APPHRRVLPSPAAVIDVHQRRIVPPLRRPAPHHLPGVRAWLRGGEYPHSLPHLRGGMRGGQHQTRRDHIPRPAPPASSLPPHTALTCAYPPPLVAHAGRCFPREPPPPPPRGSPAEISRSRPSAPFGVNSSFPRCVRPRDPSAAPPPDSTPALIPAVPFPSAR